MSSKGKNVPSNQGNLRPILQKKDGLAATRPRTARPKAQGDDIQPPKASEKHGFTSVEAELEHLRSQLEIFKQQASVAADLKDRNETL